MLLTATPALAQFIAPMRYNEGPGIKLSDSMVFHPGLDIEGRYDSNALGTDTGTIGAGFLRFLGHLDIATLSPQRLTSSEGQVAQQKLNFRAKTAVSFREYLSGNDAVKQQRAVEVDVGLLLALFPYGAFSFDVADDFARTVTPWYGGRDTNNAALRFRFAPGGGRLSFGVGYGFGIDIFEESAWDESDRMAHEISANAKWKFLPKTAVLLEVSETLVSYWKRSANKDVRPLRATLGLSGLITHMMTLVAKLGYGNSLNATGPSYNMIIGMAELGFQLGPFAKIKLGYEHGFQDAMIMQLNYYSDENIYLGYDHLILNRLIAHLKAGYRFRQYRGDASQELNQHVMDVGLGLDYQIKEWLYVGVGYDLMLQKRASGNLTTGSFVGLDFAKHQVFGKVGVSY